MYFHCIESVDSKSSPLTKREIFAVVFVCCLTGATSPSMHFHRTLGETGIEGTILLAGHRSLNDVSLAGKLGFMRCKGPNSKGEASSVGEASRRASPIEGRNVGQALVAYIQVVLSKCV